MILIFTCANKIILNINVDDGNNIKIYRFLKKITKIINFKKGI
jgi:hypothetical protein